jgi:hypothetical protein
MNSELFGRLVELLKDYGPEGEGIVNVYNDFTGFDNVFVQSRLVAAAWMAKTGYNATALQLIAEAAYYVRAQIEHDSVIRILSSYPVGQASAMADRYEQWVAMTPSCQNAVDFHNANFAKD